MTLEGENPRETKFTEERSEKERDTPFSKGAYVAGLGVTGTQSWWMTILGTLGKLKIVC